MHAQRDTVLGLVVLSAVLACSGPPGPPGQDGSSGANGQDGADGRDALILTADEPAGARCASGGTRIDVGIDRNGNGALDTTEVTATSYVCRGADGQNGTNGTNGTDGGNGHNALVAVTAEPAGANCPFGGQRIDSGVDLDDDGTLDAGEVNAASTRYVCNVAPSGSLSPSTGVVAAVKSVTTSTTGPIRVRFTLKDDRGFPLDIAGRYSLNTTMQPRFALARFSRDGAGLVSPYTVYTRTSSGGTGTPSPTMYSPASANSGTLVENGAGAGDYTYTFPETSVTGGPSAVAYDSAKLDETHVVWLQVSRQTDLVYTLNANTFFAANEQYNFVPSGTGTPLARELVTQAGCDACHAKFKAETTTSAAFHGGGRVAVGLCNVCHNPARTSNPLANSSSFLHRIHAGSLVAPALRFHGIAATYPRDARDCNACHQGAAQGDQALTNPSIAACGGCHAYVSFIGAESAFCGVGGALARDASGVPLPCNHVGGPATDATCATCHGPAGAFPTARYHAPVVPPDPNNAWRSGGLVNNTNAAYVAAGGVVPAGADVITYEVKSVEAFTDTTVTPAVLRPRITFKLKRNGADVVFQAWAPTATPPVTELMPNFVGSPSVYFAFAVPQDGNPTPGDFNATVSGYLKKLWNGTSSGVSAGSMTGPDASGFYTVTLTGAIVPRAATLLTGGIGYTYALSTAPPLVQTNVTGFPWSPNMPADGKAQGGLSVPPPNAWKVATGYTGRRPIVDNAKCKSCHGALGVAPTFHAGQSNDGPSCAFCHTPNRASSGWSAGSRYFLHAIHSWRSRTVNFTWHAAGAGPGYDEVEFPGTLYTCSTCHLPGTADFTAPTNLQAVGTLPLTTVATGTYNTDPMVNSTYYTLSPYVVADGFTNYGAGFSFNASTGLAAEAAGTTLVMSPLTAACAACHDSAIALQHMRSNGGAFYEARSAVLAPGAAREECLICHGPGRIAAIGQVHSR